MGGLGVRQFKASTGDMPSNLQKLHGLYQISALTVSSHPRKRDFFQNDGSHHLRKNVQIFKQRLQQDTSWNSLQQEKRENAK